MPKNHFHLPPNGFSGDRRVAAALGPEKWAWYSPDIELRKGKERKGKPQMPPQHVCAFERLATFS